MRTSKLGFTLAEILITIGVIGVIAAITLPSLITNYKVKVLQTQFKTADSILQQAILRTTDEIGIELKDFSIEQTVAEKDDRQEYKNLQAQIPTINEAWKKQFTGASYINNYNIIAGRECTHTMMGEFRNCLINTGYFLPNGMFVSNWQTNLWGPAWVSFVFDTNGPFKGPNRMGYDIFIYNSQTWTTQVRICNPTITHSAHEDGCYYYAHRGLNPSGNSNSYWDILYKPLSYWQKQDDK